MAKVQHYYTEFEEGSFYHVYNRTIDKGTLFKNVDNYIFFIKKFDEYLSGFVNLYAYCLLENHFHLLIEIPSYTTILNNLEAFNSKNPAKILSQKHQANISQSTHEIISHQFRKFFQSYSMAYNKQQGRIGALFQTPFKRALISDCQYFTNVVYYIHANPQKHGILSDFRKYPWSSYQRILIDKPSKLCKKEVLDWFGGKEAYLQYHAQNIDLPKEWDIDN